jgi:2,4-dienoyl-CoA reductase-like NADH-dependent reductase (Old Yellow Enzyme family)
MHDPFIYTSTTKMTKDIDLINSVVELPNGVRVPNRLVKASMEEGIGTGGGLPGKHHQRLYSRWAEGGWGMIITGMYVGNKWRSD